MEKRSKNGPREEERKVGRRGEDHRKRSTLQGNFGWGNTEWKEKGERPKEGGGDVGTTRHPTKTAEKKRASKLEEQKECRSGIRSAAKVRGEAGGKFLQQNVGLACRRDIENLLPPSTKKGKEAKPDNTKRGKNAKVEKAPN